MELFTQVKFLNKKLTSFICDANDFVYLFTTSKIIYIHTPNIQIQEDEFNHVRYGCKSFFKGWNKHFFCFNKLKKIYGIPYNICDLAINIDDIKILKKYHEKGYQIEDYSFEVAAESNFNNCAEYIYLSNRAMINFCECAARAHNLELLKFLHENNCPWDEETCIACISTTTIHSIIDDQNFDNDLVCLKYAYENGCPMTQKTILYAISVYNEVCTEYAINCVKFVDSEVCAAIAAHNNVSMLRYAHEHGCPWNSDVLINAIDEDDYEMVEYAYNNNCPFDESVCQKALNNRNRYIIIFLFEVECQGYKILEEYYNGYYFSDDDSF